MARPQKRLGDSKEEIVNKEILKENPEGYESTHDLETKIVIATHVPEMRRVVFINNRDPGYPLDFHYSSKTHPLKIYRLFHGYEHELPVEVIEHLESCTEPQYGWRKDQFGKNEQYINGRKYIFQFRNPARKAA